jgi:hypothetical protein
VQPGSSLSAGAANRGVARETAKGGAGEVGIVAGQMRGPDVDIQSAVFSYYRMR